jgi:hypothetical protein
VNRTAEQRLWAGIVGLLLAACAVTMGSAIQRGDTVAFVSELRKGGLADALHGLGKDRL